MPSTITVQSVVNFISTHADLLPLANVGGFSNEPALSLANEALSEILSDPNDWKFNSVNMPMLITCPNKQDYLFAGACIFTLNGTPTSSNTTGYPSQGWAIDLASNNAITVSDGVVTVNTLETHRIPVGAVVYMTGVTMTTGTTSAYNSVFTDNGTSSQWIDSWTVTVIGSKSVSFAATSGQNNGDVGGAPGIANFGYLTSASMVEMNNNSSPPNVFPLTARRELAVVSRVANPEKVAVMNDLGTGVLKIRFSFVPGYTTWGANLVYQAQAPIITSLTSTWAPIPDNFSALYRQALLWCAYRYLNSPTADSEYQKFKAVVAKLQATDDATSTDVNIIPENPLMASQYWYDIGFGW